MPPSAIHRQQPSPLLLAKLQRPRPVSSLVRRDRLHALLDQGAERRLTLVCAPAGFGKTTLIADWLSDRDACAWLSLDDDDSLWQSTCTKALAAHAPRLDAIRVE